MKVYLEYFANGCKLSDAPNSRLHESLMRAHRVPQHEHDEWSPDPWASSIAYSFLEWSAEGFLNGDYTYDVDIECNRFAGEYDMFINVGDIAVTSPAQWYASNLDKEWMKSAQDELSSASYYTHESNPLEQIKVLREIVIRNIAREMALYLIDPARAAMTDSKVRKTHAFSSLSASN